MGHHRGFLLGLLAVLCLAILSPGAPANAISRRESGVVIHAPPAHWNPLEASAEELNYYNFPPRPTDPEGLERWKAVVANAKWQRPAFSKADVRLDRNLLTGSVGTESSIVHSGNWGGVVSKEAYQDDVKGWWRTPYAYADTAHRPANSAQWIGLGGTAGTPLIQMGTISGIKTDGSGIYYAFYEIVGTSADTGTARRLDNFYPQGHDMYAEVWWTPDINGDGAAHFYMTDLTTNYTVTFMVSGITDYAGVTSSAEWIVERPMAPEGYYYYLTKPYYSSTDSTHVYFSYCQTGTVDGGFHYPDPGAASTLYYKIYTSSKLVQGVSTLDSTGHFQTNWYDYQ